MYRDWLRTLVFVFVLALMAARVGAPANETPLTAKDGASLEAKLARVFQNGEVESKQPRLTTVLEREVNAYLRFQAAQQLPHSLTEPNLTIEGDGRVSGRAVIDLNEVRGSRPRGWLDPLGYLGGRLIVLATGILRTANRVGRFEVQSVTVGGVPVPKTVLLELVSYYSRTPEDPDGFDLESPFELPYRIREVRIDKGRAVIVQ